MAKRIDISLKEIGEQIDRADDKLTAAARGIASRVEKKRLAAKIRKLKNIKAQIKVLCRGTYNIIVPTGGPGK
ncbi:MAG TPA: hypothetical protein VG075_11465 [Candidatus Acidoferrum sp.]|jgi:hypothetical protein|nr:hypothetical protein [Candidatus Acidoferrum sp.]